MVGPSSSHTAGACRIGLIARCLVGGTPQSATIELHGSFARTGEGHGTDKAIVGGLMGFKPDDERLRDALGIAEKEGLDYRFEKTRLGEEGVTHPNTARITITHGDREAQLIGSSLGAGRILISEINAFPVEVTGNYHTVVLIAEDPSARLESPRLTRSLPKSLSEQDVEALLAAPDPDTALGLRDKAMLETLYASGLRVTELVTLKVAQLSLDMGVVRVMGKGAKERLVPLGESAVDVVQEYFSTARIAILDGRKSDEVCMIVFARCCCR